MAYNEKIHYRQSMRLRDYDYSQNGLYFVTICVQNREYILGEIVDGQIRLNKYGEIVLSAWEELPQHYRGIVLQEFVVMPNHLHGIIEISRPLSVPAPAIVTLSEIVRALKTFSARKINAERNTHGTSLWQRNYHEHIIRDEKSYHQISEYIQTNPARWQENCYHQAPEGGFETRPYKMTMLAGAFS
jgi:REP element-mobilizing transposase RayT